MAPATRVSQPQSRKKQPDVRRFFGRVTKAAASCVDPKIALKEVAAVSALKDSACAVAVEGIKRKRNGIDEELEEQERLVPAVVAKKVLDIQFIRALEVLTFHSQSFNEYHILTHLPNRLSKKNMPRLCRPNRPLPVSKRMHQLHGLCQQQSPLTWTICLNSCNDF